MKKFIHLGVMILIIMCTYTNVFAILIGYGSVEFVYKDMIIINTPTDFRKFVMTMEGNAMLELITGERVPIRSHNLKKGTVIEFMAYGIDLRLVSAKVVYGGENAEYIEIGSLSYFNVKNNSLEVNGNYLTCNDSTKYHSNGKLIDRSTLKRTDLVKVSYFVDNYLQSNVIEVELLYGTNNSLKRTNIILSLEKNVLTIGDPNNPHLQEKFIVTDQSKIYNKDFVLVSKDSLQKNLLVDIHSWYDTTTSTFFAYEIHILPSPTEHEFNIVNTPMDYWFDRFITEFGNLTYIPWPNFTNLNGKQVIISDVIYAKAKNFSSFLTRDTSRQWIYSMKEMSTTPKEFTFDAVITDRNLVTTNNGYYTNAELNSSQRNNYSIEIDRAKSQMNGIEYDSLINKKVRITTRNGSNVNINAISVSEVIGVDVLQNEEPSVMFGLVSHTSDTSFSINSIEISQSSNSQIVPSFTIEGEEPLISEGDFVVVVLDTTTQLQAKTIYKFYSTEIIGRMSSLDENSITVSGLTFPISDKTFFRGKGNQVITKDKIEKNSIILAVTYFGPTEAFKFISKDLFKNSSNPTESFVRFVYHIYGPNPVSVNENYSQSILIFPNPSSTSVSIVSPENIVSDVTISTMLGERVFAKSNVTGTTQFSTASLPIGQYIVKITNNKSTTNQILQVIR